MANEKRLIYANALMKYIRNHDYQLVSQMGCVDKGMFTDGIEHGINIQPTVDAVEVVHGRWNPKPLYKFKGKGRPIKYCDLYYCSECGTGRPIVPPYNYCPNCGAKMDGDGNG